MDKEKELGNSYTFGMEVVNPIIVENISSKVNVAKTVYENEADPNFVYLQDLEDLEMGIAAKEKVNF